jgi:hypothetical protein
MMVQMYLRSCITGTPASRFKLLRFLVGVAEPEIYDLDRFVEVKQQVLGFKVAMHDIQFVQVLDTRNQFLKELARLHLGQPVMVVILTSDSARCSRRAHRRQHIPSPKRYV